MPLQIIHQDITTIKCDAIVNPTDRYYSGGGGADAAIHKAAGPELAEACRRLKPLECGQAEVTPGFKLPSRYVIHTFGPVWNDGEENEPVLLRSCYMNALVKAKRMGLGSVAFPLISSGTFGFPKDRVLRIAIDAVSDFLFTTDGEMEVYICVVNRNSFELSKEVALKEYLSRSKRFIYEDHAIKMERQEDGYSAASIGGFRYSTYTGETPSEAHAYIEADNCLNDIDEMPLPCASIRPKADKRPAPMENAVCWAEEKAAPAKNSLDEILRKHDDTFAVLLLKLIDSRNMDVVDCYKKANVHKNTFWKINNDPKYKPSKPTVIAFAIALELTMDDTEKLLRSAGFALAGNNNFDLIIRFYIEQGVYNVNEINEALYKYDQALLGC